MTRYAVVLTTYAWDRFVGEQCRRNLRNIESGDFFVLVDGTGKAVSVPAEFQAITVTARDIEELALLFKYDRALFWHNLDYLFISFFTHRPDYDYYLFLDYDAYIDTDVDRLVSELSRDGVDLLAQPVGGPIEKWVYARQHEREYPVDVLQAYQLFTVALSRRALAHLCRRRRALAAKYRGHDDWFWPFCEAFVPTELKLAGFNIKPLSDYGSVSRCDWWPPTLDTALPAARLPGFVHPLLDEARFITSILRHSPGRAFLQPRSRLWTELGQFAVASYFRPLLAEIGRRVQRAVFGRVIRPKRAPHGLSWLR